MAPDRTVVLVAEDDASVRMTLEYVLEDAGFDVLLAEDGERALQIALDVTPDVILLDQMMPKVDGKQVFRALKKDVSTSSIPVLVLSGTSPGALSEWEGAHWVGKPFSPDDLVARIHQVLSDAERTRG